MIAVNELIQEACEDLSLVGDGEPVSGELAASCEGLLNRAITSLNSDSYISLTVNVHDVVAAGSVYLRKLEVGETPDSGTVDHEPPDSVQGVARKVGVRWMRLTGSNREAMDRCNTYSLPTQWCYGVETEVAPSGTQRRVGVLRLNGMAPVDLRIYENSALPHYRLGENIYLSPLYHDLILYKLEERMVAKYKLYSYKEQVAEDLSGAMKAIDTNTAQNRPLRNDDVLDSYTRPADDLLAGFGF